MSPTEQFGWNGIRSVIKPLKPVCAITLSACLAFAAANSEPTPPGKLVDLGATGFT